MPFTDSGLWIPRKIRKRSNWGKRIHAYLPIAISVAALWFSLYQTKIGQRAYLSSTFTLSRPEIFWGQIFDLKLNDPDLDFKIKIDNLGNTPAEDVAIELEQVSQPETFSSKTPVVPIRDVAPKESAVFSGTYKFEIRKLSEIKAGFYARLPEHVSYRDVFGSHHNQDFCYQVSVTARNSTIEVCESTAFITLSRK